jgi:hypothetical protein
MKRATETLFGGMRAARCVLVVCALALAACTPRPEDTIVGTWEEIDGSEILQFFDSGDVVQEDSGGSMGAHYSFIDDSRMRVDFGGPAVYAPPRTYKVEIDAEADVLTLVDEAGKRIRYQRAPAR